MISCSSEQEEEAPYKIPDELAYIKRAYPYDKINVDAVQSARKDALKQFKQQDTKNDNSWEVEGPTNIGGRVTDLARHPEDSETFYVGLSAGGIFKTTDGGDSWKAIFDDVVSPSIGSIAISRSNPDIIYAGTGEANGNANSGAFFGSGVYRSEDAGETWVQAGLENSHHIGRLVIDESNPDRLWAAATGNLYSRSTDRGLYFSENGGEDWIQLLFTGDNHACIDVVVNPENTDIIYAAMWERERFPWIRDYGGEGSAIHRTIDGGQNWERLENGFTDDLALRGRIGLAISESNPNILYASLTTNEILNNFEGLYKTVDGGDAWVRADNGLDPNVFASFGWFFGNVRVNPKNPNNVYILGLLGYYSMAGGDGDWDVMDEPHVDWHAHEFFGQNPQDIIAGTDGGLYRSFDGGESFTFINNLPITQFYNIEVDFQNPEVVLGGTQDNSTVMRSSDGAENFFYILNGDGFHVKVDPTNSDLIYAEWQFGGLHKSTDGGLNFQMALEGIDDSDRNNWNSPFAISPINSNLTFFGTNKLYRGQQAESWEAISSDLSSGGVVGGFQSYATLTTIAPGYQSVETIYVGTDDGNVWVTQNGGGEWKSIKEGIPERYITSIAVNPNDDSEAIVTISGYRLTDYMPHIFRTQNFGESWTDISGNLPEMPINKVIYNPEIEGTYYIATDIGMWYTEDAGNEWKILGKELPPVVINDAVLHWPTKKIYAGTFGRSIMSLDLDDGSVSNNNIDREISIKLYPNPASENDDISLEGLPNGSGTISVLNVSGELVYQKNYNTESVKLNVLTKGLYLVKIESASKSIAQKLIIQ